MALATFTCQSVVIPSYAAGGAAMSFPVTMLFNPNRLTTRFYRKRLKIIFELCAEKQIEIKPMAKFRLAVPAGRYLRGCLCDC